MKTTMFHKKTARPCSSPSQAGWRIGVATLLVTLILTVFSAAGEDDRELLSSHKTEARFVGLVAHKCSGRTSLCPDECGASGKMAVFEITRYLAYEKPVDYGDPQQTEFRMLIEDTMKNAKVPVEIRDAVFALKPGDRVRLDWNHDYVTENNSKFPERVIVKLELLTALAVDEAKPLVGGYSQADINDERVRKAAEFAVRAKRKDCPGLALTGILVARQQVVAGMNYKLTLQLADGGRVKRAEVVIYQKLDGVMSLTSWEWK